MPMMVRFFIAVLAIFTVALFIFIFHPHDLSQSEPIPAPSNPTTEADAQATEVDPGIIYTLVIDSTDAPGSEMEQVVTGQDPLLIFMNGKIYSFNQLESLVLFDEDKNGIIDANDPRFNNLHLARLDAKNKRLSHTPLNKAGVVAIVYNPEFLLAEKNNDPKRFKTIAGDIVLSDNSRWHLRVIPVETKYLQELNIQQ